MMSRTDVLIIGAGGAGMMCARTAGLRGRKVLLVDHAKKVGGKILISGGGRCNFTNLGTSPENYVSKNPHFCKSALSRYHPLDFIALVEKHQIPYHEKKLGQQFCDDHAQDIIDLLISECNDAGAEFMLNTSILRVEAIPPNQVNSTDHFQVETTSGVITCESLVIATGGLSIPKIGATGLGYDLAAQFGLKLIERAPALDGFSLNHTAVQSFCDLSGVSADSIVTCNGISFRENTLFTHSGLSGPAILQASLHWYPNQPVSINFLPNENCFEWFMKLKHEGNKTQIKNLLTLKIPSRLSEHLCNEYFSHDAHTPLPDVSEKKLKQFCDQSIHAWTFTPSATIGYNKAEVTRGGVDTDELSSKTLECKKAKGLYFIGEVVDVTGWLGGYNFQWAWASGYAAGQVV